VSVNDIDDINLARLVYQGDVEDGIGQLINYEVDAYLGLTVPREMVNGSDTGVVHAIRITEDKFASGDPKLVNFKTYYYLAIAYGYNNYETYDPATGTGQAKPFVAGRKAAFGSIRAYAGIPHKPTPESGGTIQNAQFGDELPITRLEGQGNGGGALQLDDNTVNAIMSGFPWRQDQLTYKAGYGPVKVRVVDPLAVPDAQFEIWFQDSVTPNNLDDAYWYITNTTTGETVRSDRTIDLKYEQLLMDWGISVTIGQPTNTVTGGTVGDVFTMPASTGSMTFADPSKAWLTGIPDGEGVSPFNWIRSGTFSDPQNTNYNDRSGGRCSLPARLGPQRPVRGVPWPGSDRRCPQRSTGDHRRQEQVVAFGGVRERAEHGPVTRWCREPRPARLAQHRQGGPQVGHARLQ
jgi:hypothetical protein